MKPVLVTRCDLARATARRWRSTYLRGDRWYDDVSKSVARQLEVLVDPTPEQVNRIIGNDSWTELTCDGCDREVETAVRVGAEYEPNSPTSTLCERCVRTALAAFTAEEGPSS